MAGVGWEKGGAVGEEFALPGERGRGSVAYAVEDFGGHLLSVSRKGGRRESSGS